MIIDQSDQPECDICKTKLWDWIYSGIPAKQTEKRERYLVLFNQYCSVLITAPQKGRILRSFAYAAFFLKRKRAFRFFVSEMMIKTTKVGLALECFVCKRWGWSKQPSLALWVLCMQGWLPSLVASCPQALWLTRAEDIFVLQRCIFTVFVFVFFHCICVCICICIWWL